jgi:spoIIIJ-associated protein
VEWVETVGKSVEEAKDRALDLLGVDERDAEFEVLEEPKVGFLGRVKGSARVRARIRPAMPRAKAERRDRRRGGEASGGRGGRGRRGNGSAARPEADRGAGGAAATDTTIDDSGATDAADDPHPSDATDATVARSGARRRRSRGGRGRGSGARSNETTASGAASPDDSAQPDDTKEQKVATMPELSLDDQARIVASFLDGLVDAFGLDATTSWEHTDDENTEVRVEGANLGLLVGPKGRTLQAVTEVARSVVVRHGEGGSTGRVHVDVAGYRQRRREALARFATEVADEVRSSGVARALEPMSAADRKVVHDTVAGLDGVASTSEGEDPYRRVVINPA